MTFANADDLYGDWSLSGAQLVARNLATSRNGFNAQNYDYIMYVTPKGELTGSTGGYAPYGGNYIHMFDVRQNYLNHEIGHNLFLSHSNDQFNVDSYGSQDCVMGNGANAHLDGPHSYQLGWYPDACFPVRSYGQYDIENLAQPNTDNPKVLRFDRAAHGATNYPSYNLWIEYRLRNVGQDVGLHSGWDKSVNIHYWQPRSKRPTDSPITWENWNNNMTRFLVGGSYTEPDNRCRVQFLRENASNGTATVQLINPSGNQPPKIADQSFVFIAGTTNFAIQASDLEGNPLNYSIVSSPSVGTLTNSGGTFTFTYNGSATGTYTFKVRVNDGQYDSFDATISFKLVNPTSPVVTAGSDKTAVCYLGLPWIPLDLSLAPIAWYDASDATTITQQTSGFVSKWESKVGNSHLVQTTAANQPAIGGTNQINGLNVIGFDGTNDSLKTVINPFGASISNAMMMAVTNIGTITSSTMFSLVGSPANRWQSHAPYSDGKLYFDCGGSGGTNRLTGITGWTANQNKLLGFYCSTTDNVQQVWEDGSLRFSDASGHAANTSSGIALGYDGTSSWDNCKMGEVVVLNRAVPSGDRQKLEGYLAHKWNLATNLPLDHPFKGRRPTASASVVLLNDASATDSDPLTITWTVVSAPAGSSANFTNAFTANTSVRVSKPGQYILRLTASDDYSQISDDVVIEVRSATDYENWAVIYPGLDLGNPIADADGDGMSNRMEFIFGLNPSSPSSNNPVSVQLNPTTGTFTYTRRDPALNGLVYSVWSSTDLVTWNQDVAAQQNAAMPDANGVQSVEVSVSSTLLENPKLFVRIRAE